jgi:transcription antitermination factor NusG
VAFAKDHVKLRVLTGPFKDYEGYIIRIDRNRQLVFDFAGRAVALRGVHQEDFEVAE